MGTRATRETLYLRHEFTNEEKLEMGLKLAEAHNRSAEIEEEKSSMMAQIKERISGVEATIGTVSRHLSAGFTMHNVECEILYDTPNVGEVTYKRKDNGEVAKTRAMTASENQTELEFAKAEAETTTAPAAESAANIENFFSNGSTDAMTAQDAGNSAIVDDEDEEDDEDGEDEQEADEEDDAVFSSTDPAAASEAIKPEHDAAWASGDEQQPVKRGRGRPKGSTTKKTDEEPF